ncbi:MAG: hypothetical protein HWD62_17920 [Cyclobacteriaceae bacterium]|nr:MAG: hypothetical protein HWD62_17920 [Cyclobacteriaceae bacterium]
MDVLLIFKRMRSPATFLADEKNTKSKRKMPLISYGWTFKDNGMGAGGTFSSLE